jgi:hypothetical protein
MTDFIRLQHGAPPWEGSGASRLVETYDFYDIPLAGVIEQDGVRYLFRCLFGHVERMNIWRYTLVEPAQLAELEATETPKDFDHTLFRLQRWTPGMLAVSIDGYGIVGATEVEDWDNLEVHFRQVLNAANEFIEQLRSEVGRQSERLAAATS